MKARFILPVLAALAFGAPLALAQDAPPPAQGPMMGRHHFDKADMMKHMQQRCEDGYARAVGGLSYLEVKLQLTDQQKPLFERWKASLLSIAKQHAAKCADHKLPMDKDPVAHLKAQEARLKARLADLEAQMPSFEAFAATLSDQQKEVLREAHRHLMMDRGRRMMGGMRMMMHGHGPMGPGGMQPPPAQ